MLRLSFGALLVGACATTMPSVSPVVGPDGTRALYVSCAGSEARCFQLAGEACPSGYDYAPTPRGNFLIRCKDPMAPSPYTAFTDHASQIVLDNPFADAGLAPNPYTNSSSAPSVYIDQTPADAGLAPNPYTHPSSPPAPGSASFPPLR